MKAIDITGKRFGKLTVVQLTENKDCYGTKKWFCKCDCGGQIEATASYLRSGNLKSCGCEKHKSLEDLKNQNLLGRRFHRLTVIQYIGPDRWGWRKWGCLCVCGNNTQARDKELLLSKVKSCGCIRGIDSKHGDCRNNTETPIYRLWHRMKERCNNPNRDNAERYCLRGIRVCSEWENNYEAFREWSIKNGYRKGLQIDRINSDGNYEPENCRFVTPAENTRNQTQVKLNHTKVAEIRKLLAEKKKTHEQIAAMYGVSRSNITSINSGKRWVSL